MGMALKIGTDYRSGGGLGRAGALLAPAVVLVLLLPALFPAAAGEPARSEPIQIVNVRFGHHDQTVRVVVDLTAGLAYSTSLAADRRTLTISLPGAHWPRAHGSEARPRRLSGAGPLEALAFEDGGSAEARLVLSGSTPLRLLKSETVAPARDSQHHRVAVDLTAASPEGAAEDAAALAGPAIMAHPLPPAPAASSSASPPALAPAPSLEPAASPAPAPTAAPAAAPLPPLPPLPQTASAKAEAAKPSPLQSLSEDKLRAQAAKGSIEAMLELGGRILDPATGSHDMTAALGWFRKAADAGSAQGAYNVGQFYRSGLGVPQNEVLAAFWYGEAARGGFAPAQLNLGIMELRGIGIKADPEHGLAMIQAAAAQGHPKARSILEQIQQERRHPTGGQQSAR